MESRSSKFNVIAHAIRFGFDPIIKSPIWYILGTTTSGVIAVLISCISTAPAGRFPSKESIVSFDRSMHLGWRALGTHAQIWVDCDPNPVGYDAATAIIPADSTDL